MTVHTTTARPAAPGRRGTLVAGRGTALVSALGAAVAVAVVPLAGEASGTDGSAVANDLVASAGPVQGAALLGCLGGAALILAAIRLGRQAGGLPGAVIAASGTAVSVLFVAYYAALASVAVVATNLYEQSSAGLGDAGLVMLNVVEITRFAPGIALVVAVLVSRRSFPKPVVVGAGVLTVLYLLPFTSWIAALAVAVWLGLAAAAVSWRDRDSKD